MKELSLTFVSVHLISIFSKLFTIYVGNNDDDGDDNIDEKWRNHINYHTHYHDTTCVSYVIIEPYLMTAARVTNYLRTILFPLIAAA